MKKRLFAAFLAVVMLGSIFVIATTASAQTKADEVFASMSTEDKVSQMIMPAFRYSTDEAGEKTNVTEITEDISATLSKHGYSGVILYGQNIVDNAQTVKLVDQLQKANASNSAHTQLLIATDQEGGTVSRLAHGTTWMGNMSLGAINDTDVTAEVASSVGNECAALGINVDFSPVVDVNNNPANPVIGTRSFSDDPQIVAQQGSAFVKALNDTGVISTLKHFPGHGDTDTDSHTGLPMVDKSLDELMSNELVPFKACVEAGSQMIMTAHIQYPQIEKDKYTSISDGEEVYVPATLSDDIITGVLREKLGYDGVVITDAMEMDAVGKHFNKIDAAKLAIEAGVDILLMPVDTTAKEGFANMDSYISTVAQKADGGDISMDKINTAVMRILKLKEKNGLLDAYSSTDIESKIDYAVNHVGTKKTHAREWELTKKAITLVKNDNNTLPLTKENEKTLVLVPYNNEVNSMVYGIKKLEADGKLPNGSSAEVVSFYKQAEDDVLALIDKADNVVYVSEVSGASGLKNANAQLADKIEEKVHSQGGKFIVLSNSLPYDAARYQKADAIMIAYLDAGMNVLPEDKESEIQKYGPNMPVAMYMMYSADDAPTAKLPINIPKLDDEYSFTGENLYERGYGLTYVKDITACDVTGVKNATYTGKSITLALTVKDGDKVLVSGTDYDAAYSNNVNAGKAEIIITGKGAYSGKLVKSFTIAKAKNPMTVKVAAKKVKLSKLKKKNQTVKAVTVSKAKGKLSFKLKSVPKKIKKYVKINSKGVITFKKWKSAKKGTYKLTVKITSDGGRNYNKKSVNKKVTIKVK